MYSISWGHFLSDCQFFIAITPFTSPSPPLLSTLLSTFNAVSMSTAADLPSDRPELRLRQTHGTSTPELSHPQAGTALQDDEQPAESVPKDKGKKTFGRTPDGTGLFPPRVCTAGVVS